MTDNENKYWAFLSYSHQDNREPRSESLAAAHLCWGNWWHNALQTFSIPAEFVGQVNGRGEIIPERIDPLFQDEQEMPEAADLSTELRQALERSTCLIVICSPRSAQSQHVNEVVRYFKQLGRDKNILPIVVAGEPNASDDTKSSISPEAECFVPALRHPVSPDGTLNTTRPAGKFIFVDARHGAEKREILAKDHRNAEADLETAKTQLIALLIGVGFNGLWRREQKRHFFDFAEAQRQAREAQLQVAEIQRQLQEAQRQSREAQNQALETQNLPREIHAQIQEAQDQALAAQNQASEAQNQLQEFQNKIRDTQAQLEEARNRALAAENKVLETQQQAQTFQDQLEATRHQAREAQSKVVELQSLPPEVPHQIQAAHIQVLEAQKLAQNTQSQLEETRLLAQNAHDKFLTAQTQGQEFQNQARSAQTQLEETRAQVRETQAQVLAAQHQAQEAQSRIQESQNQTRAAQNQVQEFQIKNRAARRLTKVFAVMAVLALMAAGVAFWQRHEATQALANVAAVEARSAADELNREPIQQLLQTFAGAEQARRLDELAAGIPRQEIPEALKASSVILNDQHRSHFQKWLLLRLGWENPVSAMASASAMEGNIVNDEGLADSHSYFQLAVLDNWMQTDLTGAFSWVCQLPDADARNRALEKILPALSLPSGTEPITTLNQIVVHWARQEPLAAAQFARQLPELFGSALGEINEAWFHSLDRLPETIAPWPWTKFLQNAKVVRPIIVPVETEMLTNPTNAPIEIKAQE